MIQPPFPALEPLILPDWLDDLRVPDSLLENAYDTVPANYRARLKTGMAIAAALRQSPPASSVCSMSLAHSGQQHSISSQPAAWAGIFFDCRYEAAARLTAAFVKPLLAGVANVFAVCIGGQPGAGACLALEMSGIGDAFILDETQCASLLKELHAMDNFAAGRLLALRGPAVSGLASVKPGWYYQEKKLPEVYVQGKHDREMLAFLHGRECLNFCSPPDFADVVILENTDSLSPCPGSRLILGPGCEGFWQFPDLDPDIFSVKSSFFCLADPLPGAFPD